MMYATQWCFIAEKYELWKYPYQIFLNFFIPRNIVSVPFNYIVIPTGVIIWIKHYPEDKIKKILWYVLWAAGAVTFEYILIRFSTSLEYTNKFNLPHSFVLWNISFYIFISFQRYVTNQN